MTKRQRNSFYKKLLKEVCEDPYVGTGICYYLEYLHHKIYGYYPATWEIKNLFPELDKYKPKNKVWAFFWFPCTYKGWEKRIDIIIKCIEDTE